MTGGRWVLGGTGVLMIGAGLLLLPWQALASLLLWSVGLVVLHDAVWAPLSTLAGWSGARLLPAPARTPVLVASGVSVTLALLALPVLGSADRRPDNASVLDRDYAGGLAAVLALVWLAAAAAVLVNVRRGRRDRTQPEMPRA
jgi:hypothetical protein